MLQEKSYNAEEWEGVMGLLNKTIFERKDLIPKGFLMVGQIFNSVLEEDGKLFSCKAWGTSGKVHVQCKAYIDYSEINRGRE